MKTKIANYTNIPFSPSIVYLYLNRLLIQIGSGIVGVFGVIFFFEKFNNSITDVLFLFMALYIVFAVTTHFGAKFLSSIGMRKMMILSIFFLTASVIARFLWEGNPFLYLILFFIFIVLYKMFYWVPYHVEFAAFTDRKKRGRQMAILGNISDLILAVLPIIGGFVITIKGYDTLFLISAILIFISMFPLFYIHETKEKYTWGIFRIIKELFRKDNRPLVWGNISDGIQNAVATVVWPVFIFIVLRGDYLQVGIISSLIVLIVIVLRFAVGAAIDKLGREKVLKFGSIFATTGWLAKLFIDSGTGIFIAHTYHSFGDVVVGTSFDVTVYDGAAENGHFIDEYTVLKETSLLLGKALMLGFSVFLISLFGIKATFIIAAVATFLMTAVSRRVKID